jgi:hypothetical protein
MMFMRDIAALLRCPVEQLLALPPLRRRELGEDIVEQLMRLGSGS